jgi:hypothetical protein
MAAGAGEKVNASGVVITPVSVFIKILFQVGAVTIVKILEQTRVKHCPAAAGTTFLNRGQSVANRTNGQSPHPQPNHYLIKLYVSNRTF